MARRGKNRQKSASLSFRSPGMHWRGGATRQRGRTDKPSACMERPGNAGSDTDKKPCPPGGGSKLLLCPALGSLAAAGPPSGISQTGRKGTPALGLVSVRLLPIKNAPSADVSMMVTYPLSRTGEFTQAELCYFGLEFS